MKKVLLSAIFSITGIVGIAAQSQYVLPIDGNVNLRTAASKTAAKAGTLTASDLLPCLEELDGWYKVNYDGKDAFVSMSVARTCDAIVPEEIFGKDLGSAKAWDKTRHQGLIKITRIDQDHAFIQMEWMRVNLPAESYSYIATVKDGKITATHSSGVWVDPDRPLNEILNDLYPLEKQIPVGFDEFNNTIFFNGAEFSEYE